jgi:hypothetical protein
MPPTPILSDCGANPAWDPSIGCGDVVHKIDHGVFGSDDPRACCASLKLLVVVDV